MQLLLQVMRRQIAELWMRQLEDVLAEQHDRLFCREQARRSCVGERDAAIVMAAAVPGQHRITVAADKGYDTRDFVACLRGMHVTPHIAQHTTGRRSAIDARTTRHPGYAISQQKRKLVEQGFGWIKTIGGLRKLRHRGGPLVAWIFTFTAAAYNIVRLRRLLDAPA